MKNIYTYLIFLTAFIPLCSSSLLQSAYQPSPAALAACHKTCKANQDKCDAFKKAHPNVKTHSMFVPGYARGDCTLAHNDCIWQCTKPPVKEEKETAQAPQEWGGQGTEVHIGGKTILIGKFGK